MAEPSNFVQYDFRIAEAQTYADLHIAFGDMRRARVFFAGMSPGKTWFEQEASWIAGVIAYARPFGKDSLRWNKSALLSELSDAQRQGHDHIMDLRNGYIAHSVGSWEGVYPCVELAEMSDGTAWIHRVTYSAGRIAAPSSGWQNESIALVDRVSEILGQMIEVERAGLEKLARSWPIERIVARGTTGGRGNKPAPNPRSPARKPYGASD